MKLRSVGSLITGIGVLALGSGVAVAGLALPNSRLSEPGYQLESPSVQSTQGRMSLVCLGGVERAIQTGVNAEEVDEQISGGAGVFLAGTSPAEAEMYWEGFTAQGGELHDNSVDNSPQTIPGVAVESSIAPIPGEQRTSLGVAALSGATSLSRDLDRGSLLMGGSMHSAQAGDLRGLAYNSCIWPTTSMWLVGSATTVGTSNRLVVANPSLTSIQVEIRAFSSVGEVPLGSSSVVVLPSKAIRTIELDGLVDEDEHVAFYLSAESGQFAATIQTNALAGFVPAGTDFISAGRSGRELVIPGLHLPAGEVNLGGIEGAAQSQESALVHAAYSASVRIVNPDSRDHTASVSLIDTNGHVAHLPGAEKLTLPAGSIVEISLDGVEPGAYSVYVTADSTVAAGAQVSYDSGADGIDVEWLAARSPITDAGAYVAGGAGTLVVTPEIAGDTVRSGKITWTAYDASGQELADTPAALEGTYSAALPAGTHYVRVRADVPMYAAVASTLSLTGGEGISWIALNQNGSGSSTSHINYQN